MKRIFAVLTALVMLIPVCGALAEDLPSRITAIESQLAAIQAELDSIKEEMNKTDDAAGAALTLSATEQLLTLLAKWDGKYVILVNKDTDIKTLKDMNGKDIYCDMYQFGIEVSVSDMSDFMDAAGVEMQIGLGNNIPQFFDQMAGDRNLVAFIPKSEADSNSLQEDPNLMVLTFK
jgi:hypothetical protein